MPIRRPVQGVSNPMEAFPAAPTSGTPRPRGDTESRAYLQSRALK